FVTRTTSPVIRTIVAPISSSLTTRCKHLRIRPRLGAKLDEATTLLPPFATGLSQRYRIPSSKELTPSIALCRHIVVMSCWETGAPFLRVAKGEQRRARFEQSTGRHDGGSPNSSAGCYNQRVALLTRVSAPVAR